MRHATPLWHASATAAPMRTRRTDQRAALECFDVSGGFGRCNELAAAVSKGHDFHVMAATRQERTDVQIGEFDRASELAAQ
jgi:hypothetical protein